MEKEMYLLRPLSLHVKLISLFCMQIHSGHVTRDRHCFCVVLAQGLGISTYSIFTLVKFTHDAADKFALTKSS